MSDREEFTDRVLMGLVSDLATLTQTAEQIRVKIETMAKERGIPIPETT